MEHGSADCGPLDPTLRRLYIDAVLHRLDGTLSRKGKRITRAKPLKMTVYQQREMQSTLTDLRQRLSSLPTARRYNEMRSLSAMEQAEQALSWIVKQMGLEKATVKILAYAVGADICPKMNSSFRYRQSQIARSVLSLLKSEATKHWATGKPMVTRWPCRGWYFKRAVYKIVEKSHWLWARSLEHELMTELRVETHARTLELHGMDHTGVKRHVAKLLEARNGHESTTVARLEEPRVGTPVDPECPSCLEHGWRYACAIHNTDEERAARWKP